MKHRPNNAGKAYSDGFAAGLRKGRDEREAEVAKLKQALNKALAENLANRPKPDCPQSNPALPLEVIERPLLVAGQLRIHAASGRPFILIDAEQPHDQKLLTLWHEVVHLLRMAGNYSQDEAQVEEAAHRLAAACPDALAWVGITRHQSTAAIAR